MTTAPTSVEILTAKYEATIDTTSVERLREPDDYGLDVLCVDSLKTGRYVTGYKVIGQRLYHMIVTRPGTLRGSERLRSWGLGIESLIGSTAATSGRGRIRGRMQKALKDDQQVGAADVTVIETKTTSGLVNWQISADVQAARGPFRLVLNVDEGLNAELLKLEPLRRSR